MNRIIGGLDGKPPQFAGGSLGSVRRLLWEVGASVLVAAGLIVGLARFIKASARRHARHASHPVLDQT